MCRYITLISKCIQVFELSLLVDIKKTLNHTRAKMHISSPKWYSLVVLKITL